LPKYQTRMEVTREFVAAWRYAWATDHETRGHELRAMIEFVLWPSKECGF
jgi:hypothetical protein